MKKSIFDRSAASQRVFDAVPNQAELARRLGLTRSAVSNLKKRKACTLPLVIVAAEVTGKPIEWFLFGKTSAKARRTRTR